MSAPERIDVMGRLASMALRYDEWEGIHDAVAGLIAAAEAMSGAHLTDVDLFNAQPRLRAALARCQPLPSDMGTPTIGEES